MCLYLQNPPSGNLDLACQRQSSHVQSNQDHSYSECPGRTHRARYTCSGTGGRRKRCPETRWVGSCHQNKIPGTNGTSRSCERHRHAVKNSRELQRNNVFELSHSPAQSQFAKVDNLSSPALGGAGIVDAGGVELSGTERAESGSSGTQRN